MSRQKWRRRLLQETGPARRAAEELTWFQQHARPCCAAKRYPPVLPAPPTQMARSHSEPLLCLGSLLGFIRTQSPSKAGPLFTTSSHGPLLESSGGVLPQPGERAAGIARSRSELQLRHERCTARTIVRHHVSLEVVDSVSISAGNGIWPQQFTAQPRPSLMHDDACSPSSRGPLLHPSSSSSQPEVLLASNPIDCAKASARRRASWLE